ncbi:MAG TPA: BMP family ABC transporter substrate-binding protein [Kofleriaceae bacterium]|nr:BMP family ABC transporter substrate-binding protein [Kofleriaceae bacterium]
MIQSTRLTPSFVAAATIAATVAALLCGSSGCKRVSKETKDKPTTGSATGSAIETGSGSMAGSGSAGVAPAQPDKPGSQTKIGLVFDVGGLGDKSFNDSAHRGLVKAKDELGVQTQYIEPGDGSDRESALRQRAAKGDDLVIGVGFIFSDDITKLAKEFPKVKFACIDYSLPQTEKQVPDNLVGLRFREHEGSFLVGAVAGRVTKAKKLGFVGGMKIPLIRKFEAGYEAGVKQVCPDCQIFSGYAGTEPKAFADPTKGKELALSQYNRGADIVYHASGKTGDGVFDAAKEKKKLAIGVDSDQFPVAPCCVLTSMIKNVDVAVFETIKKVVEGKFQSGELEFGLKEGGVGFVYDDNNKGKIPQAVADEMKELTKQIVEGKITVPTK